MKRIAIDLNDVIRNFTGKFEQLYVMRDEMIGHDFDLFETIKDSDGDFRKIFPFDSPKEYDDFVYGGGVSLELFGCAPVMNRLLTNELNTWLDEVAQEKDIEVMFVCPNENYKAIQATFFFLSKMTRVRKVVFTRSTKETWQNCDVLVTANPLLIKSKPLFKKVVKINTPYNENYKVKYSFDKINDFFRGPIYVESGDIKENIWYKVAGTEKDGKISYGGNIYVNGDNFRGLPLIKNYEAKGAKVQMLDKVEKPWKKIVS